jgi:hypothetical protein
MSFDFDRFSAPVSFDVLDSLDVGKLKYRSNEPSAHEFVHGTEKYLARGYTNEEGITADRLSLAVASCAEIAVNHEILLPGFLAVDLDDKRKGKVITVTRVVEGDKVGFFRHRGNEEIHRRINVFRHAYSQAPAYDRGSFSIGLTHEPTSYAEVGNDVQRKFDEVKSRINSVIGMMDDLGVTVTDDQKRKLYAAECEELGWDPKVFYEEAPKPKLYLVRIGRILRPEK